MEIISCLKRSDKKSRLLFTDTGTLKYEIETKNTYDNFNKNG